MPLPNELGSLTREIMEKFQVPGMAILTARSQAEPDALYLGVDAAGVAVHETSLFNLASITKIATALCVLRLVDAGQLELDNALAAYAPDAQAAQAGVTLRTLLCHISGLPLDIARGAELYGKPMTMSDMLRECLSVTLKIPPHTRVVYSNVGYGLLAVVIERVTGRKFSDVLYEQVLDPLHIKGYLGDEPPRPPMKLLDIRSRHAGTDIEPFNSRYFRALGLPWAGLVTTPRGALNLVRAYAGYPSGYLSEALRADATSNQTDDLPGGYGGQFDYPHAAWGLGVDVRGEKKIHWTPSNASPRTFGHAGSCGCVVWHDPDAGLSWAILGTRTADNGWLVRGATKIAEALLEER